MRRPLQAHSMVMVVTTISNLVVLTVTVVFALQRMRALHAQPQALVAAAN